MVEIFTLFEKMRNRDQLRARNSVGRCNSTRVNEGRKMLNSSRDKNEGTYRSGERGEGPAL